ncbi:flagellar biosynthesis protein FlgB [Altererythrobacter halimionae]|uniref:Flagellar basal body rod protein FlgB n=2 Tax=Alteriqipengyuania halimionae TaxID=1926630 RepID=A0A6I4U7S9_9SPHN|nr:flagellar biosynthesis protein FlgB [Alteriqipengyuania halimionae]
MRHLSDRQQVIAQNIANGDTPGYKAREVEAPSFAGMVDAGGARRVARPTVQVSSEMRALGARPQTSSAIVLDENTVETKPDGNNVTLEEQVLKLSAVQSEFTALTNLYRKQMQLLKSATGRGNG